MGGHDGRVWRQLLVAQSSPSSVRFTELSSREPTSHRAGNERTLLAAVGPRYIGLLSLHTARSFNVDAIITDLSHIMQSH